MPLTNKCFLIFVDDIYEDLELWYPRLRHQGKKIRANRMAQYRTLGQFGCKADHSCRIDGFANNRADVDDGPPGEWIARLGPPIPGWVFHALL